MSALRARLGGAGATLALVLLAGCQTVGPVDPDPIDVASSGERTEDAIRDALRRDGWEIESWSPGEVYAGKVDAGESLRIRIHLVDETLRISWIDDGTVEGSFEEVNERKREIRRALRNLSERIEYHIESVDLEARIDAPPGTASLQARSPSRNPGSSRVAG